MIFCTIGTQMPFDRFVKVIDSIAPQLHEEVIVQTLKGTYIPKNVKVVDFLSPKDFENVFAQARLIVAHAGMGTIITALLREKPIVVFPRRKELKEHRSNHQIATAEKLKELGYIHVAENEQQLKDLILSDNIKPLHRIGTMADTSLINSICQDIESV